ncbi:MAG: hypothetical protein E7608_03155 [Ruminococcaceae bacterium]|nr:hypothetical protein [Oscillospiraceae bacterium]
MAEKNFFSSRLTAAEMRKALADEQARADAELAKAGKLSAASRMAALFDEGTFVEVGAYVGRKTTELDSGNDDAFEPVVTGYGAIDGTLVFAFSQDFARLSGALGEMHAKKIAKIYEMAIVAESPIIGIFDSAGAKVLEGADALAGYGSVMACAANAEIPQIAVVAGPCTGHAAVIAQMFDFVIAAGSTGKMYMSAAGEKLGTAEELAKNGTAALVAENDADALAKARKLVPYFTGEIATGDTPNRLVSVNVDGAYDVRDVIANVFDAGSFTELYAEHAKSMVCGLATMNGHVVAVVANNPAEKDGRLCGCAANKAAEFIEKCDAQDIPLVTLVDSCGVPASEEAEAKCISKKIANLAKTYALSYIPKVTVTLGRSYGAAYTAMGAKALGADVCLALESAKIAAMEPSSAVTFLGLVDDESKHEKIAAEWAEKCATPVAAAKSGHIDDIISSDELRQRIAAALEMLL